MADYIHKERSYIRDVNRIQTYDKNKLPNGYLQTIVNIHESDTKRIEQVYLTACEPGDVKGPHMHWGEKEDRFYCIEGQAVIVCRHEDSEEITEHILEAFDGKLLIIPPYNSHAIVALGGKRATILSMPNEGYCEGQVYNQVETTYEEYDWARWWA